MWRSLDPADRRLLIGAAGLLVVLVVVSVSVAPPGAARPGAPSSYSPAREGAKAAFLLLRELGYQAEHWERPPTDIPYPPGQTVLILADPANPPSQDERAAIGQFVRSGGWLLATGAMDGGWVPEAATMGSYSWIDRAVDHDRPLVPSPLARNAPEITLVRETDWAADNPSAVVVYGTEVHPAVVTYQYGSGRIIWWAGAMPLENQGIREASNLALLLNSVGVPGRTHLLWDEYYHGLRGSVWAYLGRTPLPYGLAQIGLLFLALLASYARRVGPAREPPPASRLSPVEFVETVGDLYASAHAAPAAVAVTTQRLRFLLARRLGLPADASPAALAQSAAARLGWSETALAGTLERAERAARQRSLSDSAALALVQQLHDFTQALAGPTRRQEK
jgi:Domain of unknown function (DUF4350)